MIRFYEVSRRIDLEAVIEAFWQLCHRAVLQFESLHVTVANLVRRQFSTLAGSKLPSKTGQRVSLTVRFHAQVLDRRIVLVGENNRRSQDLATTLVALQVEFEDTFWATL